MSEVRLKVGERRYTIACADGQEQRIEYLAGMIDQKIQAMGTNLTSNEAKNLLFAALMLADELDEARVSSAPSVPITPQIDAGAIAERLEHLASAFENVASALESGAQSS